MKASTISIYVAGKLVLRASNLEYDEDKGKSAQLFPPAAKFSGSVGEVLTLGAEGVPVKAAGQGANKLEIVCEIF